MAELQTGVWRYPPGNGRWWARCPECLEDLGSRSSPEQAQAALDDHAAHRCPARDPFAPVGDARRRFLAETTEALMTDRQYRAFLNLLMCSDPWPLSEEDDAVLRDFADTEAAARGHATWIEAFHA